MTPTPSRSLPQSGQTPLWAAAELTRLDAMERLLAAKADLEAKDGVRDVSARESAGTPPYAPRCLDAHLQPSPLLI